MNILIITTRFPPDTAIAAVRPYMFAKYLAKKGHKVTVIRSGEVSSMPDDSYIIEGMGFDVYSYMGENAPAERFRRGEQIEADISKSRALFLPKRFRKIAGKMYHFAFSQREFKARMKQVSDKSSKLKELLIKLKDKGLSFDIVFATYGEMENIYAGKYASEVFSCKYILDFRDLIAQPIMQRKKEYRACYKIQKEAIQAANLCTCVSEQATEQLKNTNSDKEIITLYNGYEPYDSEDKENKSINNDEFSLCYTGQMYTGLRDASSLFHAISVNCQKGVMIKDKVRFYYAGSNYADIYIQAKKFNMETILVNMGYLGRKEIIELQKSTDIFTVLSWNTKTSQGILTGKLYEGIRSGRPILVMVSGNEKNSELKTMNERYHYGFCYEEANKKEDDAGLCQWLKDQYSKKISGELLLSTAKTSFFTDFRYDVLTGQLEKIMHNLVSVCSKQNITIK